MVYFHLNVDSIDNSTAFASEKMIFKYETTWLHKTFQKQSNYDHILYRTLLYVRLNSVMTPRFQNAKNHARLSNNADCDCWVSNHHGTEPPPNHACLNACLTLFPP